MSERRAEILTDRDTQPGKRPRGVFTHGVVDPGLVTPCGERAIVGKLGTEQVKQPGGTVSVVHHAAAPPGGAVDGHHCGRQSGGAAQRCQVQRRAVVPFGPLFAVTHSSNASARQ